MEKCRRGCLGFCRQFNATTGIQMARKLGAANRSTVWDGIRDGNRGSESGEVLPDLEQAWWQAAPHFFDRREAEALLEPARLKAWNITALDL
jgi:hypothetical protein